MRISEIREIRLSREELGVGKRAGTGNRRRKEAANTTINESFGGGETIEGKVYSIANVVDVCVDLMEECHRVGFRLAFFC